MSKTRLAGPQTVFDKLWAAHEVAVLPGGQSLLYIDLHILHEVTTPQAFRMLEERGLSVRRPDRCFAVTDHNVPTVNQHLPLRDALAARQVALLQKNCRQHGITLYDLEHTDQGIVHVVGPELGYTQPGMTIVCGDSHTSTHGAFGTLAFGIGTSEVGLVLGTQCLVQAKPRQLRIHISGRPAPEVRAKDVILYVLQLLGANGAAGYFIEYAGPVVENMSMEERMTLCNMSIELGARGGLVGVDAVTLQYLRERPRIQDHEDLEALLSTWSGYRSDPEAEVDRVLEVDISNLSPMITYGTNPGQGIPLTEHIPRSEELPESQREAHRKALAYMALEEGQSLLGEPIDSVFIGSCTNARFEDLREVATLWKGRQVDPRLRVLVVPGSRAVLREAQKEGLDKIFAAAGAPLREPGCSACLGMNEDKMAPGTRCLSTSNRNFEGRQGPGARTLLCSPRTAALSALYGKITLNELPL
ncbi:MAG: 3-isopropylmalate dehydratase large subunit [Nitritalea sp.]